MILTMLTEDKTYSLVSYNIFRNNVFTKVKIYMGSKEGVPNESRLSTVCTLHTHTL